MTNGARLPRGPLHCLLPVLAASAAVAVAALPAAATQAAVAVAALPPAATQAASAVTASAVTVSTAAGQSRPAAPWWLTALHLPAALDGARTAGRGVTVAVLSTGVDAGHPDLAGTVTSGPDFSKTGRKRGGEYWGEEGTAVASLIAGHGHGAGSAKGTTGNEGITGVAPGTRILSVQVTLEYDDPLNADPAAGRRLPDAIAAGIRYAVGHGAMVIALPLDPGTLGPSDSGDPAAAGGSAAERSAVSFALARNVVLVAPAGDNGAGTNAVNYPAAYRGVIAVGATGKSGALALFTGARSYVALTAPGAGVIPAVPVPGGLETDPAAGLTVAAAGGGYQSLASTDMSAALTAGVTALIRSRYPRLTVPEVTAALEHGATAPAGGGHRGRAAGGGDGELNATAALTAAAAIAAAHPAPSPSPSAAPSRPAASHPAPAPAVSRPAAAPAADPGHLVRSLVVGLVITATVLIAGLIGATTLTRARRRRARRAGPDGGPALSRAGPGAHGARHARGQSAPARPPAPAGFGAPVRPEAAGFGASAGFGAPAGFSAPAEFGAPAGPAAPPGPAAPVDPGALASYAALAIPAVPASPAEPPAGAAPSAPAELSGVIWPSGPAQRQRPHEEPPWPPASPPGSKLSPEAFLPAEPEGQPDTALAPWEKAPADYATPPSSQDPAPWPVTSTGPMYVWNPAATTGPLNLAEENGEDSAG